MHHHAHICSHVILYYNIVFVSWFCLALFTGYGTAWKIVEVEHNFAELVVLFFYERNSIDLLFESQHRVSTFYLFCCFRFGKWLRISLENKIINKEENTWKFVSIWCDNIFGRHVLFILALYLHRVCSFVCIYIFISSNRSLAHMNLCETISYGIGIRGE